MQRKTTADPYDVLGVARSADQSTIKKAYRRRAGETHPDRGGSDEQFGRVNSAYLLLSDPARRKRFDETGEDDSEGPDNAHAQVLQIIVQAFDAVLGSIQAQGVDPVKHDMLAAMRDVVARNRRDLNAQIGKIERSKAELERLLGRFERVDSGENAIEAIIAGRCAEMERALQNARRELGARDSAAEMLRQYRFLADLQPLVTFGHSASASTTTSWIST